MNRSVVLALFAAAVAGIVLGGSVVFNSNDELPGESFATPVRQVEVVNFPDPQNVGGTVSVDNFPQVQSVTGQVEVTNLPAMQEVTGTVEVANLPSSAPPQFEFVGVTSAIVNGGAGLRMMHDLCYQEFGGRMAFSDEATTTVPMPSFVTDAWVQPRPTIALAPHMIIDAAGNVFVDNTANLALRFTCGNWSWANTGYEAGSRITPEGTIVVYATITPNSVHL